MKTIRKALGLLASLTLAAMLAFGSFPVSAETPQNLVSGGTFEDFIHTQDVVMKNLPDFNMGMASVTGAGNSPAVITRVGNNAQAKLCYNGTATGDNSNLWMLAPAMKKGAGKYTVSFDLKAEGLSTGDFIGFDLLGPNGDANVLGNKVAFSAEEYNALAQSSEVAGYKHFSAVVDQTQAQADNNDTLVLQLFNKKGLEIVLYADNVSVKKAGAEEELMANGDYEVFFKTEAEFGPVPNGGYGSLESDSPAAVVTDGSNAALKLSKKETKGNFSSFFKLIEFDGPGVYTVSFDVKYPSTLADTGNNIGVSFRGPTSYRNSGDLIVGDRREELDTLPDSVGAAGYKAFIGNLTVDKFTADNIDSLAVWFNTAGLSAQSNNILIDNLSVVKSVAMTLRETPREEDGYVFEDLVKGGDFEKLAEGYTFLSEPQADSDFWGSTLLDSPAKIVSIDGSKAMQLKYNGEKSYASAFVFLDPARLMTDEVYELGFDYKTDFAEGNGIHSAFHVSFLGPTGQENYKTYLGFTDEENSFTNGVNKNVYPFTVTESANGWKHFAMKFYLDNAFIKQVDSIRFLLSTEGNDKNTATFDNVKFGVLGEKKTPPPVTPEKKGCGKAKSGAALAGILSVLTAAGFIFIKKR